MREGSFEQNDEICGFYCRLAFRRSGSTLIGYPVIGYRCD
uniref:Uncharacterized protein n=1 Tax=Bartonella schoenbuchensis (strain DSM 13525 / NCTC 13165 / R1) TaxID=687861 RepID=E6Z1M8_BARSR|nr:hypothetical protein BARSC_190289 [Bartonella schoenbuchensis R1]